MSPNLEKNKQTAMAFYDLMFNACKPREAIQAYVGDTYIQHNPDVGDGKEAFIRYFENMAKDYAGIDIFRFDDNGKIVEHWDVLQTIPATATNDNSIF